MPHYWERFEVLEITYHIFRPIRRTVIFSLEILEKIMVNVFLF